jgi:hypothetical protein
MQEDSDHLGSASGGNLEVQQGSQDK